MGRAYCRRKKERHKQKIQNFERKVRENAYIVFQRFTEKIYYYVTNSSYLDNKNETIKSNGVWELKTFRKCSIRDFPYNNPFDLYKCLIFIFIKALKYQVGWTKMSVNNPKIGSLLLGNFTNYFSKTIGFRKIQFCVDALEIHTLVSIQIESINKSGIH